MTFWSFKREFGQILIQMVNLIWNPNLINNEFLKGGMWMLPNKNLIFASFPMNHGGSFWRTYFGGIICFALKYSIFFYNTLVFSKKIVFFKIFGAPSALRKGHTGDFVAFQKLSLGVPTPNFWYNVAKSFVHMRLKIIYKVYSWDA